MSQTVHAWLYAVLAGRVARLRDLVARDDHAVIATQLDDVAHLAKVNGLAQLEEAVRHARDLDATGRPIAMVIDAIGRAIPDGLEPGADDRVPAEALLVNLQPIARSEGASCELETAPFEVSSAMGRRFAVAIASAMGEALDSGSRSLKISITLEAERVVANVESTDLRSTATFALPAP